MTGYNQKYVDMWRVPTERINSGDHSSLLQFTASQFDEPRRFIARVDEIYATALPESFDLLELADGRTYERFSRTRSSKSRRWAGSGAFVTSPNDAGRGRAA